MISKFQGLTRALNVSLSVNTKPDNEIPSPKEKVVGLGELATGLNQESIKLLRMESRLQSLREELESAHGEAEAQRRYAEALRQEVDAAQVQLRETRDQCDGLKRQAAKWTLRCFSLRIEFQKARGDDKKHFEQQLAALTEEKKRFEEQLHVAEAITASLTTLMDFLVAELDTAWTKISKLEAENKSLRTELTDVSGDRDLALERFAAARAEVQYLRDCIEMLSRVQMEKSAGQEPKQFSLRQVGSCWAQHVAV